MERQRPEAAAPSTPGNVAAVPPHPVHIPALILRKLEAWCDTPAAHHSCMSLRQAIHLYRRAKGSSEEAPTAKVVAALYLLLVTEGDPLTLQERLRLDSWLQPALDARPHAA